MAVILPGARVVAPLQHRSSPSCQPGLTMPFTPYTCTSPDDPGREDNGLFGPGSVTWQIMNSRIIWVAALRALYLQALHPRVIRGTLQNAPASRRRSMAGPG